MFNTFDGVTQGRGGEDPPDVVNVAHTDVPMDPDTTGSFVHRLMCSPPSSTHFLLTFLLLFFISFLLQRSRSGYGLTSMYVRVCSQQQPPPPSLPRPRSWHRQGRLHKLWYSLPVRGSKFYRTGQKCPSRVCVCLCVRVHARVPVRVCACACAVSSVSASGCSVYYVGFPGQSNPEM